ncbi:3,4-dihydroxy-2-butanone-4-phosphate synthase [Haloarcula salinisoli]|uniref:3,4-dihydroxy-2-butanone 4-phosphate synthase n=1 Tax=Haloarcula salinisoli TaxID=2487746 RepID=A0A8J7YEH2_9EURY|nr:3,4-dihydroxy-2-butanone-4-phosphate synthase [Halomicroarcula salinisoli]MBX0287646.1 3,4-dihydroxy-2-butanone-4-phosphate synthase [Halomicroarcula salinisoli]MBX0304575.1 3,4-dihydroxy-2-butanone-4-phosphate synthase [Halomicroarcula salinisoli]
MSRSESADGDTAAAVQAAIDAFARGEPVLIHDAADREGETDIVYPAGSVTPEAVARLRNDAGGLVCVALSDGVAEDLELPFMQDVLDHPTSADHELAYDERSSFSLTVNHRDTFTGITDDDRSLTITELAALAADPDPDGFGEAFRSPGHVHLLRAAPALLADREGHTELGVALAAAADQPPAVVVCEMLDDETGGALSPADARAYAADEGLHYVEGRAIVAALA